MARLILLLVILSWPFEASYMADILGIGVEWGVPAGAWPCAPNAVACYAYPEEVMYLPRYPADWRAGGSLERLVFHELQHHLQFTSGMFEDGRWDEFRDDVADFLLYGHFGYNDYQRARLRFLMEDGDKLYELHAELPLILGGVPPSLRGWYPWFGDMTEICEE